MMEIFSSFQVDIKVEEKQDPGEGEGRREEKRWGWKSEKKRSSRRLQVPGVGGGCLSHASWTERRASPLATECIIDCKEDTSPRVSWEPEREHLQDF